MSKRKNATPVDVTCVECASVSATIYVDGPDLRRHIEAGHTLKMSAQTTDVIERLRGKILEVDVELINAIGKRGVLVDQLFVAKQARGLALKDTQQENDVVVHARIKSRGPYSGEAIAKIFRAILEAGDSLISSKRRSDDT